MKSGKEHKKFSIPGLSHDTESEDVQDGPIAETEPKSGQRQQPKRKNRGKPAAQGDAKPGTTPPGARPPGAKPPGDNANCPGGDVG
jgi:hypothetical protein